MRTNQEHKTGIHSRKAIAFGGNATRACRKKLQPNG
jgi:hypothetical protein